MTQPHPSPDRPTLTVFTAVYGVTDPLLEPSCQTDAHFVCFTDDPKLKSERWEIVLHGQRVTPTRDSRLIKALSHRSVESDWSLWMDASMELRVDPYTLLDHGEFVCFRHHVRDRVTDEAEAIIQLGLAYPETIRRQLANYHAEGFDTAERPMSKLSAMTAILRRHSDINCRFNEMWASEIRKYSPRDQMSVDYVAWRLGLSFAHWPGTIHDNPYFRYHHTDCGVNDK